MRSTEVSLPTKVHMYIPDVTRVPGPPPPLGIHIMHLFVVLSLVVGVETKENNSFPPSSSPKSLLHSYSPSIPIVRSSHLLYTLLPPRAF